MFSGTRLAQYDRYDYTNSQWHSSLTNLTRGLNSNPHSSDIISPLRSKPFRSLLHLFLLPCCVLMELCLGKV